MDTVRVEVGLGWGLLLMQVFFLLVCLKSIQRLRIIFYQIHINKLMFSDKFEIIAFVCLECTCDSTPPIHLGSFLTLCPMELMVPVDSDVL